MPSHIVYHSTVVEVVAGFLTRHLDHLVTAIGYSDFRKTSNIDIVLSDRTFMLAHRHPGEFERSSRLHGDRPSCVSVVQLADLARRPPEPGGASASFEMRSSSYGAFHW